MQTEIGNLDHIDWQLANQIVDSELEAYHADIEEINAEFETRMYEDWIEKESIRAVRMTPRLCGDPDCKSCRAAFDA